MSIQQQVAKKSIEYVLTNYGNLLSIDEPYFDQRERLWRVGLRTDYPRLIKNDSPDERYVRTLQIKDIGTIWLDEGLIVVKQRSTSRNDSVKTLKARLRTWEERAENIIVKASALQLARTGIASVFLNPIRTILGSFIQEESAVITFEELEKSRDIYLKWICLLEDLQLVRKESEGYTYGNVFTELMRKAPDDQEFLAQVLAYVIRERYPVLKEAFKLRQFETLVHLDSCYYRPALEAGKPLFLRAESLFHRYSVQYSKYKSPLELRSSLLELCNSEALCKENKYYVANAKLFTEMQQLSEEFLRISSPRV